MRGRKRVLKTPVFLLAVHQKLVKQEENPLLDVSCRNLQEDAVHEQLRARICDIRALKEQKKRFKKTTTHYYTIQAFPVPPLGGL